MTIFCRRSPTKVLQLIGNWDSKCVVVLYSPPIGHVVAGMHLVNFTIKPTYVHVVWPRVTIFLATQHAWGSREFPTFSHAPIPKTQLLAHFLSRVSMLCIQSAILF